MRAHAGRQFLLLAQQRSVFVPGIGIVGHFCQELPIKPGSLVQIALKVQFDGAPKDLVGDLVFWVAVWLNLEALSISTPMQ